MKTIELRKLKSGEIFQRKKTSKSEFIKGHYNRKNWMYPASFCCSNTEDINREIQLNPSTLVYIDNY